MSIGLSLWTNLIIIELHCKSMPLFHNQLSNMYYIAYKAFLFYLFSSGAHKQIFLLVDSHLFGYVLTHNVCMRVGRRVSLSL